MLTYGRRLGLRSRSPATFLSKGRIRSSASDCINKYVSPIYFNVQPCLGLRPCSSSLVLRFVLRTGHLRPSASESINSFYVYEDIIHTETNLSPNIHTPKLGLNSYNVVTTFFERIDHLFPVPRNLVVAFCISCI